MWLTFLSAMRKLELNSWNTMEGTEITGSLVKEIRESVLQTTTNLAPFRLSDYPFELFPHWYAKTLRKLRELYPDNYSKGYPEVDKWTFEGLDCESQVQAFSDALAKHIMNEANSIYSQGGTEMEEVLAAKVSRV